MSEDQAGAPPKKRFTIGRVLAIVVAIPLLALFVFEAPLAYAVKTSADDGFPNGVDENGGLLADGKASLGSYKPTRIATYLRAPIATWRGVACLGLSMPAMPRDPASWSGVPIMLARLATNDEDPGVRKLATKAIANIPHLTTTEAQEFLAVFEKGEALEDPFVLQVLAVNGPDCQAVLAATLKRWAESPSWNLRAMAFTQFCESADDASASKIASSLYPRPPEGKASLIRPLARLIARRPESPLALLKEKPDCALELCAATSAPIPRSIRVENTPARKALFDALEDALIAKKGGADPQIISFLARTPRGRNALAGMVPKADDKTAFSILEALDSATGDGRRGPPSFRFEAEQAEGLVQSLKTAKGDARRLLAAYLGFWIGPKDKDSGPFKAGTGPLNPANEALFRELMDDDQVGGLLQPYFIHVAALTDADVPRLEGWIRRRIAAESAGGKILFLSSDAKRCLVLLRQKFPAHAATAGLLKDYPQLVEQSDPAKQVDPKKGAGGGAKKGRA